MNTRTRSRTASTGTCGTSRRCTRATGSAPPGGARNGWPGCRSAGLQACSTAHLTTSAEAMVVHRSLGEGGRSALHLVRLVHALPHQHDIPGGLFAEPGRPEHIQRRGVACLDVGKVIAGSGGQLLDGPAHQAAAAIRRVQDDVSDLLIVHTSGHADRADDYPVLFDDEECGRLRGKALEPVSL